MFVLTTSLIVLIPKALVYKLDAIQWIILAITMFMGYGGGALYLMAYLTPEDNLIGKKKEGDRRKEVITRDWWGERWRSNIEKKHKNH